jgi:hypothetical protein
LTEIEEPQLRETLRAASVLRRVTRSLLRAVMPSLRDDSQFERLARLPFVEAGRDGLIIHDAVHEAIRADLEAMELTLSEYHALLRNDLHTFMVRCFTHLYPSTVFMPNWHLELIAGRLAECMSGKTRRLIVNVPPRHLKSLLASVALPAFILGHDPSVQIICISYAMELAEKLARDCRSIMTSSWYKLLFPKTRLSNQRPALQELITTNHGSRLATSVGGILTGRGCDLMIVDDAAKPEEAVSETQRKKVMNGSMVRL